MTSVETVYKNTWNICEFLWSIIQFQRKSALAVGCPRSLHCPLQWKRSKGTGWREDHIPEWDIQALYNLELIDTPESLRPLFPNEFNGMMEYIALALKFCYLHRRIHWQLSPSAPLDLLLQHGAKGRHSHHHVFLISFVSSQSFVNRICFPRTPSRSI